MGRPFGPPSACVVYRREFLTLEKAKLLSEARHLFSFSLEASFIHMNAIPDKVLKSLAPPGYKNRAKTTYAPAVRGSCKRREAVRRRCSSSTLPVLRIAKRCSLRSRPSNSHVIHEGHAHFESSKGIDARGVGRVARADGHGQSIFLRPDVS